MNSPALTEVEVMVDEGLLGEILGALEDDTGAAGTGVELVTLIGVTNVVGTARLTTLAPPAGEVTGTGAGTEGAAEEFIAESSQALIQP